MLRLFSLIAILALTGQLASVHADVPADLITSLPGYTDKLPTRQWSGYLDGSPERNGSTLLHYWFVESSRTPKSDPVVLWLNGGPGCSSVYGYLREHGPLAFNGKRDSSGVPAVVDNPYAWTRVASVVYLESPAGVGFSYYANNSYSYTNDEITSQNSLYAVIDFFRKFAEFAGNDFYIFGESYAGIYIPTLVDRIRLLPSSQANIQLKGFAVGNACWGNEEGTCAFNRGRNLEAYTLGLFYNFKFFEGHAFVEPVQAAMINRVCGNWSQINTGPECINALRRVPDVPSNSYNIYSLYDTCKSPLAAASLTMAPTVLGQQWLDDNHAMAQKDHRHVNAEDNLALQPDCIPITVTEDWLNSDAVQQALHVTQAKAKWSMCSNTVGRTYDRSTKSLLAIYPTLISQYRVLVYSGDTDACVPEVASERWTRSLGYKAQTAWHPWTVRNQQVAGYAVKYSANFTFATVKGAGHMVPEDNPETGFELFSRWLAGTDL